MPKPHVRLFAGVGLSRRGCFRLSGALLAGSGWLPALATATARDPKRKKSVILLWMNGGPATIDLWDLKPGHDNGGPFKEINTAANGLRICEHLPRLAKCGKELAVVRSMSSKEGDHTRARFVNLTGYAPQGAIQFPAVGALVAHELGDPEADLPGYVSITRPSNTEVLGGGFLGPKFSPLVVGGPASGPDDLTVPNLARAKGVDDDAQTGRLKLLAEQNAEFAEGYSNAVVDSLTSAAAGAARLMRPSASAAFRLDEEKPATRDAYGRTAFGQGCLLARRLVERGVPFVEVSLDGWDTHTGNFPTLKRLAGTLDAGFAALLDDLKERGLLESTLVACLGDFGRTPRINSNVGRDHWPQAWSAVLAGGGIRGGRAVGKTTADGTKVDGTPTRIPDFIATIVKAIGIDPRKQNASNVGRPIRIADPEAKAIEELL